jgi:broad specificity phosphatase PhoE
MPQPVIYYIRHGETEWNALGRFQGSQDIPLNEVGRRQARAAAAILRRLLAGEAANGSLPFVASPLGRARQTMELMRSALELPPEGYDVDHRLHEIRYGRWEGSTLDEMRASDPDLFHARERDVWGVPPPGGESYATVTARMREWYGSLAGDTVAVAHGGTARALLVALGISSPEQVADLRIEQGVVYVLAEGTFARHD